MVFHILMMPIVAFKQWIINYTINYIFSIICQHTRNDQIKSCKHYYNKGKGNSRASFTYLFSLTVLVASFIFPVQGFVKMQAYGQQNDQAEADATTTGDSFVLYYGIVDSSSLVKILEVHPSFVILNVTAGQSSDAIAELHKKGIKAVGSLGINYGKVDLKQAIADVDNFIAKYEVDGIFIDQVNPSADQYLDEIHDQIKRYGEDKMAICNPGMVFIKENLMRDCDILSFEHEWRMAGSIEWFNNFPASRYMGFNSNAGAKVGGAVGDPTKNLADAHNMGIQYQYTTYDFTMLPSWLDLYKNGESINQQQSITGALTSKNPIQSNTTAFTDIQFSTEEPIAFDAHITVKKYSSNETLYTGITPATVRIPVNTTIEVTWLNPPGSTYANSFVSGAIKTFDLTLGKPIWGGIERFYVPFSSNNLTMTDFKDI